MVMLSSFAEYFKTKASQYGKKQFISDLGTGVSYSYTDVDNVTDRLAGCLKESGIKLRDKVALLHKNHTDFILAYLSIIKAGAAIVPINPLFTAKEVCYILQDSGADCLITSELFSKLLEDVKKIGCDLRRIIMKRSEENLQQTLEKEVKHTKPFIAENISADDLAFLIYTSGTTGQPKGVMLSHQNLVFGGANTAQNYGLRETDVVLLCVPMVHIFAHASHILGSLNGGGSVIVMERFQTEKVLQGIEKYSVTWFAGVPTMFVYLLDAFEEQPRKFESLRMALSGGASLSIEHLKRFESRFDVPILEVYGLTESTGLVTGNPVYGVRKPGSIGINVSGVSVNLVKHKGDSNDAGNEGEIVFKGPNATLGYWNRPELTAATIKNGWVYTGDKAWQDKDGYFFIRGRKDELIVSGGYNIYPKEIEDVIYKNEDVLETAVIGEKDRNLGEVPKAFVSLKEGSKVGPSDIQDFCSEHLAKYKIPKYVEIVRELPKSSTGKILKKLLRSKLT